MAVLLSPWLGVSTDAWAGIIVAVGVVVVPALLYRSGRLRPLSVRATEETLPHASGGSMTVVTVLVTSRIRDPQNLREAVLAEWPPLKRRLLNPRWRTKPPYPNVRRFDFVSLPAAGLSLGPKDTDKITGQIRKYPPFASTRVLIQGIRKRPFLARIKKSK